MLLRPGRYGTGRSEESTEYKNRRSYDYAHRVVVVTVSSPPSICHLPFTTPLHPQILPVALKQCRLSRFPSQMTRPPEEPDYGVPMTKALKGTTSDR
jgi:hypothetical protein